MVIIIEPYAAADIDWDDARAAAKSDAQKFNGLTGYLVTITI